MPQVPSMPGLQLGPVQLQQPPAVVVPDYLKITVPNGAPSPLQKAIAQVQQVIDDTYQLFDNGAQAGSWGYFAWNPYGSGGISISPIAGPITALPSGSGGLLIEPPGLEPTNLSGTVADQYRKKLGTLLQRQGQIYNTDDMIANLGNDQYDVDKWSMAQLMNVVVDLNDSIGAVASASNSYVRQPTLTSATQLTPAAQVQIMGDLDQGLADVQKVVQTALDAEGRIAMIIDTYRTTLQNDKPNSAQFKKDYAAEQAAEAPILAPFKAFDNLPMV